MAECFFAKLSLVMLRKPTFLCCSRFSKHLSNEVSALNNGFNNYTACFKIRGPPSTASLKIYEVFFITLVRSLLTQVSTKLFLFQISLLSCQIAALDKPT